MNIRSRLADEAQGVQRTTYARARLWAGIGSVGTWVVVSVALLATGAPTLWLGRAGGSPAADFVALLGVLLVAALLALPFDVWGGYVLPRRHGRSDAAFARFLAGWSRGTLVLLAVNGCIGTLILVAGRAGGRPAALAVLVLLVAALHVGQEPFARLVGGLKRVRPASTEKLDVAPPGGAVFLRGTDAGFSGGFAGLSSTLVLPEHWLEVFSPRALALLSSRREAIVRSGSRRRSVWLAGAWNVAGFGLASLLPGAGVTTVAELVTTMLGFTLWTFLGLLGLPTPSRRASVGADALVLRGGADAGDLEEAVRTLDGLQDEEPERSPGVESVFHPVPSVARRLAGAGEAPAPGCWHLARTALYFSYAGLSLLPRAVHCNLGRPELWVYLPSDG